MQLLFSHANGYPPDSYRVLLTSLSENLGVPVSTHAHRPLVSDEPPPTFLTWQTYASDLIERIEGDERGPVWLIGHSMGAASAVLAASRRPDLFAGIVALDPVLVPTHIWFWARVFSFFKPDAVPIVKRALARPHVFESSDAAFDFYRGKRVFAGVSDTVLMDYVAAGHITQPDGSVTLRHSGAWEACIYRSVPRMTGALKAAACPMLIVAGETSDVLNGERLSWAKAIKPSVEIQSLAGGHLLPLESPEACANAAADFIRLHSSSTRGTNLAVTRH